MPFKKGHSQQTISENIREFHTGKTYAHTREKFGKHRADLQAVAAAMKQAGMSDNDDMPHHVLSSSTANHMPMFQKKGMAHHMGNMMKGSK